MLRSSTIASIDGLLLAPCAFVHNFADTIKVRPRLVVDDVIALCHFTLLCHRSACVLPAAPAVAGSSPLDPICSPPPIVSSPGKEYRVDFLAAARASERCGFCTK